MALSPQYASSPARSSCLVRQGDQTRFNNNAVPAGAQLLFQAGANGSRVDRLEFDAIGPTVASIVRIWTKIGSNT
jgi:hypothetical protein